jgi:hypothetical protein
MQMPSVEGKKCAVHIENDAFLGMHGIPLCKVCAVDLGDHWGDNPNRIPKSYVERYVDAHAQMLRHIKES